ncbi:hypothetical protein V6C03_13550 [Methyloligella sp. 2.7D]|uniref:hypothetical protein n=1 Tax=unclassified Methyloligella TaxID=2625955 RepID=UPI00157E0C6D|nr:hypothetical protein [Methyloligella sp. GL2]QKP77208.1 hypothetical protein HT051_06910 [Methyloligella sp. GL2]
MSGSFTSGANISSPRTGSGQAVRHNVVPFQRAGGSVIQAANETGERTEVFPDSSPENAFSAQLEQMLAEMDRGFRETFPEAANDSVRPAHAPVAAAPEEEADPLELPSLPKPSEMSLKALLGDFERRQKEATILFIAGIAGMAMLTVTAFIVLASLS